MSLPDNAGNAESAPTPAPPRQRRPLSFKDRALRHFRRDPVEPTVPASPEAARARVFEHWSDLDALCRRRFPNSENVAHEGLLFVLDKLETNKWERVRSWEGAGNFMTYLATMSARLLTDFTRAKFGHVRAPSWLAEREDPLWHAAYRLVAVERQGRQEAVELLVDSHPLREREHIAEVVATVIGRCRRPMHYTDVDSPLGENTPELAQESTLDEELTPSGDELSEALARYIDSGSAATERVADIVSRLRTCVELDEQDRLLLRLRYVEGLKMTEIVKLQGLEGDAYKRYRRIFAHLRTTFAEVGLLDN